MGRVCITHGRRETECDDVRWIHLAQVRDQLQPLVNTIMDLHVGYKTGNSSSRMTIGLSRWALIHILVVKAFLPTTSSSKCNM